MLILNCSEIKYATSDSAKFNLNNSKQVGLDYYDRVFLPVRIYSKDQLSEAIKHSEELLEFSILIEEKDAYSLCLEYHVNSKS